jgi:cytochrome c peroxidase
MNLRLLFLVLLILPSVGCKSERSPAKIAGAIQTGQQELTGAEITGHAALSQRNALFTQPFPVTLLTPDGRLALSLNGDTATFRALADPSLSVSNGAPAFGQNMTFGAEVAVNLSMPAASAALAVLQNPDTGTTLSATQPFQAWAIAGQGSLALDPRMSPGGKPFAANNHGECVVATTPPTGGSLDCYRLIHFQPRLQAIGGSPPINHLFLTQARVAVTVNSRTVDPVTGQIGRKAVPDVVGVQYLSSFEVSRSQDGPTYLSALEPSTTADGRLMVSAGGHWAFNETPWNPSTWTRQRNLSQLFDDVRADVAGVRNICRRLSTGGVPNCAAGQEESFERVYPLAAHPIYLANGQRVVAGNKSHLTCGYNWITPEGTDVFCRLNDTRPDTVLPAVAIEGSSSFEILTGMHTFAFGQHTGWLLRRLDGPVNARRFNPEALAGVTVDAEAANSALWHRTFSPVFLNTASGFWAENRVPADRAFPILREFPLFQFMIVQNSLTAQPSRSTYDSLGLTPTAQAGNMQYWEASFSCSTDPNCLLHMPMNEMFYSPTAPQNSPATLPMTPDISANTVMVDAAGNPVSTQTPSPYIGSLQGSCVFAGDAYGASQDERYLSGFRGTGIACGASGRVALGTNGADAPCRRSKACLTSQSFPNGFTAEVAVLPLFAPSTGTIALVSHVGLWSLRIVDNRFRATVEYIAPGGARQSVTLTASSTVPSSTFQATPGQQASQWSHVSLHASSADGEVGLFINGARLATAPIPKASTFLPTGPAGEIITIGPAGQCAGCPAQNALFIDELRVRGAPVPTEQLAAAASAFAGRSDFLGASDVRALLSSYFRTANPRQIRLQTDGFPMFVKPEDLRVPQVFAQFLTPGREGDFARLVEAGEQLFRSPVLSTGVSGVSQAQSSTGQLMSCSTCHVPERNFTDGRQFALGLQQLSLNTPTILDRAFGTNQFFGRRSTHVVDLALRPVVEPTEMNGDLTQILNRINNEGALSGLRQNLRDATDVSFLVKENLEWALGAYQLAQISVDSLFTRIVTTARSVRDVDGRLLTLENVRFGRGLFEGKARCSSCHSGSHLSDELPHDTGVSSSPRQIKTPTLRDISATAPYFHDGSRSTLRQVIEFYNSGGTNPWRARDGVRVVDPELRPLSLTNGEMLTLEDFLRSLRSPAVLIPDITAVQKLGVGTNSTELHTLDGFFNYASFSRQIGTALGQSSANHTFEFADFNADGRDDLFVIFKSSTGSGMTEVHILDGATNFSTFLLHTPTALGQVGSNFEFEVAKLNSDAIPDVWAIMRSETGSGKTELHILDGATNYQSFLRQTGTIIPVGNANFEYEVADWNHDGFEDLFAIFKSGTASGKTEVHIASGANNHQGYLLNTATAIAQTGANWDFELADYNDDRVPDVYGIFKSETASGKTEVHILNGANMQVFLLHKATALAQTDSNYEFIVRP